MTEPPSGAGAAAPLPTGARTYAEVGPQLLQDLRAAGYRKIVLQVPAGLVRNALDLGRRLEEATGARVVHLNRACFGACDPPSPEEAPGAQALVTLGHAPIPNMPLRLPTYFVEMRSTGGDPQRLSEIVAAAGLPRRLGGVASVQHLDLLGPLAAALAPRGYELRWARGDRRLLYPGQALGCNYSGAQALEANVEGYLFLGTGLFHPLGLAYAVERPVWALDPLQGALATPLDREAMVRRRLLVIAQAMSARRFGILASSLDGQNRQGMASALREKVRARGREAEILLFDRLDARDLLGRDVDAYVCTACPRIALDDGSSYDRPVLTAPELLSALGDRPLVPYRFDTYH